MKIFIYKIYDTSGKIYYGSTKSPKKRFQLHLNNAIKNYACSSKALNHLEWKMEILQEFDNVEDARTKEGQLILNNECVNINVPGGSLIEQRRRSWKRHQKKNYARIDCECGGRYSLHHKWSHFRTQKHINHKNKELVPNNDILEVDVV